VRSSEAGPTSRAPRFRPYVSASDLETEPVDGHVVFADGPPRGGALQRHGRRGAHGAGGVTVTFDDTTAALLLDHLPPAVRIRADSRRAQVLAPVLELLGEETARDAPGSATMREQLTRTLSVPVRRRC
jgi:hypothetical protein